MLHTSLVRPLFLFLVGSSLLLAAGCVTKPPEGVVTLRQINISIGEITNLIRHTIPLGIRTVSPNNREFSSQHFLLVDGKDYAPAKDATTRYYARMLILNSSRPFDLEIEVLREVRQDVNGRIVYAADGYDLRLARLLKTQVKEALSKRRDDLNLIDDFRVF